MSPIISKGTCVAGVGARTPVGTNAISSTAAVRAGIAAFAEHPYMVDKSGDPMNVALDAVLSGEIVGYERFLQIGIPAASEALTHLLRIKEPRSLSVVIGLPESRPGLPRDLGARVEERFKGVLQKHFGGVELMTLNAGHSSALIALEEGHSRISNGTTEFCLIGGIDSYLEPETLEWLDEGNQLHSESNSWGFIPGEAAGFCLLCSQRTAEHLGLNVLARILAVSTARESKLIKTDAVCVGEGLTAAIKQVLQALPENTKIDEMICDLNGEPYRADEFGYAIVRVSERLANPSDFLTPADCWGDVGAASGTLFVILSAVVGSRGGLKGPHMLLSTSSESGQRCAGLLMTNPSRKLEV
jgi:3-oxoacyl-[acyl-carrier-protein] synthase I